MVPADNKVNTREKFKCLLWGWCRLRVITEATGGVDRLLCQ